MIPIGRSVIVPANGSLPNIILSPRAIFRIKRVLEQERFDVLHLHEPMTPVTCISVLALATAPIVATHHASGELGWMKPAIPAWGFLASRIDQRIAVSERARESASRWLPGDYEIVPNGVLIPADVDPGGPRAHGHLRRPPGDAQGAPGAAARLARDPRRTGARLQICGSDPLAVRLLLTRLRVSDAGIDILGFLPQEELTSLLARTKALDRAVARRRELRDGADAGVRLRAARRRVGHPRLSRGDDAGDRPSPCRRTSPRRSSRRSRRCSPTSRVAWRWARRRGALAIERYAWSDIARRLEGIYERAIEADARRAA